MTSSSSSMTMSCLASQWLALNNDLSSPISKYSASKAVRSNQCLRINHLNILPIYFLQPCRISQSVADAGVAEPLRIGAKVSVNSVAGDSDGRLGRIIDHDNHDTPHEVEAGAEEQATVSTPGGRGQSGTQKAPPLPPEDRGPTTSTTTAAIMMG